MSELMAIGVDPGDSTGIVVFIDRLPMHRFQLAPEPALQTLQRMFDVAKIYGYRLDIGVERFVTLPGSHRIRSAQNTAPTMIGDIRRISPVEIRLQSAADAKALATNTRLRALGLWTRARDVGAPDANDVNSAMRHVLLLLARHHARIYEAVIAIETNNETGS